MRVRNTLQTARLLGINPSRLSRAVWSGRMQAPEKGPGGAYQWNLEDIRRASWIILGRDIEGLLFGGELCGGVV